MENIIDELKQVFEFEGEISETNIEINKAQQMLTIKNIVILRILNAYKKEYNLKFVRVDFNCNLFDLFEKYNSLSFDGYMYFATCNFNNDIDCNGTDLLINSYTPNIADCKYAIEFSKCFFNSNINLSNIKFFKYLQFKKTNFGNDNKKVSINFEHVKFYDNIDFDNVNFYSNIKFVFCSFENGEQQANINFNKSNIYNDLEFSGSKFYSRLSFLDSVFGKENSQNEVKIEVVSFYDSVDFSNNKFYSDFEISGCEFKNNNDDKISIFCYFDNNNFYKKFNLSYTKFEISLNFIDVNIINNKHEVVFENTEFLDFIGFDNTDFDRNTIFKTCTFKTLEGFENKEFNKNLEFMECVFKENISFKETIFHNFANFEGSTFEKAVDFTKAKFKTHNIEYKNVDNLARFTNTIFKDDANFSKVEFNSKPSFTKAIFEKQAIFNNAVFGENAFFRDCKFLENAFFKSAKFQKYSYFTRAIFHGIADISNAIFVEYANFEKAKFKSAVYFDKANFKNFINMSNCTINDVVSFYSAKLYNIPYLSGLNISSNGNFNLIYTETQENDNIENMVNNYSSFLKDDKIDIVKGLRDSFRILKSSLISQHNLLDASFYRVNELKAKELEMDLMRDKLSLSESLENILFKIYKNTSNHHSDLLRILCFTLCMAGLYIIMSCLVTYAINTSISFAISAVFFGLVCFRYRYCKKDYLQLWFWGVLLYVVFWSIVFDVLTMFCFGMFVFMVYVLVFKFNHIVIWCAGAFVGFILVMYNPQTILPLGGIISQDLKNYHLNQAILNLDETTSIKLAKTIDVTISTELKAKQTLLDNVKVLNDSVFDECASLNNAKSKDNTMQKINFIYYLMMILCLFSLQKTARKNSIMPN